MNQSVPDFHEIEDDYWIPTTSGTSGFQKPVTKEEGITELVWQNGQIVMQNQRSTKRTGGGGEVVAPAEREIRFGGEEQQQQQQHLFMQEDEMASWLQYSLDDSTFNRVLYGDLLYSAPPPPIPITTITQPRVVAEIRPPPAPPRPPVAPTVVKTDNAPRLQNFGHFSRIPARPRAESVNISLVTTAREWTVVESNETQIVRPPPEPRVSHSVAESTPLVVNGESPTATDGGTSATGGELAAGTCDLTVSSSPGGSRASFSASGEPHQSQRSPAVEAAEDRKRKARENDDSEYQSEDIEFEATETKKQARGSTWPKRSRAAEVHNLSERRRRDRINEKMKALQELIPRCNKLDKASMLDEAIEYLKSLQLQVQMMSMGCPMVPMMYPGMQQYMPAMCLGMGMNRPIVPYPSLLPGSPVLNPAAHMGPAGFPMPAPFPIPQVHVPDPSGSQASNLTEHVPYFPHYQHQPNMPNFVDPYQQFIGVHQGQLSVPQNQAGSQPGVTKPSTSREGNHDT